MTRALTPEEFLDSFQERIENIGEDSYVIERDGRPLAIVVSPEEYEFVRRAKAAKAISIMDAFASAVRASGASVEELHELEQALDRKA